MMLLSRLSGLALLLGPLAAHAAAGQVLFALGRVEVQRGGQTFVAQKGTSVEVGDTLVTGPTGLTQVRLKDGALLSLRYGSSMVVQEFQMPAPAAAGGGAPAVTADPGVRTAGGRSVLRLLRGAFRTVTGLIGRSASDSYSVVTPVATIGIRGTDYSAAYCAGDCGTTPDGLYVGVSNGEIELTNDGGALVLSNDQYGYVKDNSTPPDETLAPPEVLDAPVEPRDDEEEGEEPGESETAAADDGASPDGGFSEARNDTTVVGSSQPEGDYELRPGVAGSYAFATTGAKGSDNNGVYTDERGSMVGFLSGEFVSIGTANSVNEGADAGTGLRWGRWTGGIASVGGNPLDLTTESLHWVYAAGGAADGAAALPITGSASYALVGNTDPTDDAGNVGLLGNATLNACFSCPNQQGGVGTVDSTLNIGINSQVWVASGSGSIAAGAPLFDGSYTVNVNDAVGSPVETGTGGFSGFLTGGGAGLGFNLVGDTSGTTVSGSAAFVLVPGGQ